MADVVEDMINKRLDETDKKLTSLQEQYDEQITQMNVLKNRIEKLELENKLKQLRLYGMKEIDGENLKNKVKELFQQKFGLQDIQIEECYRVGPKRNSSCVGRRINKG
ncbi:uncharacterized protein LOC123314446 [Coccinella septempunctata]|uniref:uncharacterized protein LOC123314446 n=1 Tax=Coccinella septempunctata TaxID=41139 RepID=UPI001D094DB6|nr:uncharacterized protein LOC123314446 [Coccinella septempunctata]